MPDSARTAIHIRGWPAVAVPLIGGAVLAFVGLVTAFAGSDGAAKAFNLAVFLAGAWMAWRAARGGLVVTSEGVEARGELRAERVPWSEVQRFEAGPNWSVIPWQRLHLVKRDGKEIVIPYVASIGRIGRPVGEVAADLNTMYGSAGSD